MKYVVQSGDGSVDDDGTFTAADTWGPTVIQVKAKYFDKMTTETVTVVPIDDETVRKFDLTTNEERLATVELSPGADNVRFTDLPPGRKTLELWSPTTCPTCCTRTATAMKSWVVTSPSG